jgi:histidinol dehydrogenase
MMEELHGTGELVVEVEKDGQVMVVKFTYGDDGVETEDYEIREDEIMDLARELKDINNKYKKNS